MSYTIYGIRVIGESEVRYVGRTAHDGSKRLAERISEARAMPVPSELAKWVLGNAHRLEVIILATIETYEESKASEREAVRFCLALGFRLFNQWLVPAQQRIAPRKYRTLGRMNAARRGIAA